MSIPKVSIIVPTYNVEKYAAKCFDSILAQTLRDIEIILVDDGSTDSSGNICDEYADKDDRIKVIHQQNKGLGLSRNSGMAIAKGEYIGFVDSDDCVSKDMFGILYKNAKECNADISYCQFKKFSNDTDISNTITRPATIKVYKDDDIIQYLLDRIGLPPDCKKDKSYPVSVCCGIFSRELLKKINASFVSEREFSAEDMIFDIDVIPSCKVIVHTNAELYYYRYTRNSLSTSYNDHWVEQHIKLYGEMCRRLGKIMEPCKYKNSTYRFLISKIRDDIVREVRFSRKNGYKKTISNIKKICENKQLIRVLNDYEYLKLPFKSALICFMIKHHLCTLYFVISYFYEGLIKHSIY